MKTHTCAFNIKIGNIWVYEGMPDTKIFVTTNNTIINNKLVMGAGIALQAKNKFPKLQRKFTKHIKTNYKDKKFYGILPAYEVTNPKNGLVSYIGALQTKIDYKKKSTIKLIKKSLKQLDLYSASSKHNENIYCVMPGIGLGGLSLNEVLYCLYEVQFTNNVTFFIHPNYLSSNI